MYTSTELHLLHWMCILSYSHYLCIERWFFLLFTLHEAHATVVYLLCSHHCQGGTLEYSYNRPPCPTPQCHSDRWHSGQIDLHSHAHDRYYHTCIQNYFMNKNNWNLHEMLRRFCCKYNTLLRFIHISIQGLILVVW